MIENRFSLIEKIQQKISITEKEKAHLLATWQSVKLAKNEYLIKEGYKSQYLYFILSGYVRCFHCDDEGNEITTELLGNDFIPSFESFIKEEISTENIQCVKPCEVLRITKSEYDMLYQTILEWPVFCKEVYEELILRKNKRLYSLQNLSAKERYAEVMKNQPGLIQNIPIKYMASYLGIKQQSLSRIRKGNY